MDRNTDKFVKWSAPVAQNWTDIDRNEMLEKKGSTQILQQ